jgi:hypothetical protein
MRVRCDCDARTLRYHRSARASQSQTNFQLRLRCVDLAMSSHLCIPVAFVFGTPSCFSYKRIFTCAADDSVLKTMAASLYLSGAGLFSLSPLTDRPRLNISLQPAFDIKTMVTVIIGYLPDDSFMTPPMRVNAAVPEFIFM